jgi:hypothetical protein
VARQQSTRVVVEKKGSGCWGALAVMLLIGAAIEYWYVAVGFLVLIVAAAVIAQTKQTQQQQQLAHEHERRRPGPRDAWLNEVAVALADLELIERARNTGAQLGGVPIEGDIGLDAERFSVFVTLFGTDALARQAELALRAKPEVRAAESDGRSLVKTQGRVLYTANGRGGVVDEFGVEEVISAVDKLSLPPSLPGRPAVAIPAARPMTSPDGGPTSAQFGAADPDPLAQIRKLGDLREAGVLTDAEFDAKKTELLRRI